MFYRGIAFNREVLTFETLPYKVPSSKQMCRKAGDPRKSTYFANKVWLLPSISHHGNTTEQALRRQSSISNSYIFIPQSLSRAIG